ncbi:MAG: LamG domain-containing protein, partial [Gammaproteobacteria bacterium]|nr:LamG domain-containing protein [Gammaproteobacteria bacterium]
GVYKPGQSVALYVNGVKVAEDTSNVPAAIALSGRFRIGARADNATQGLWDGQIDDVRIAGRALSESEIQELMNTGGGLWQFNEGSGNLASDVSGNNNHGTIQGATWTSGMTGHALDFDGETNYVAFEREPALQGEMTVSAWVRPETGPNGVGRLVVNTYEYNGGNGNQRGWFLGDEHGDTDYFYFRVHGPGGDYAAAIYGGFFAEYDDQWVHVTGVYKPGQSVALYINGVKEAEDTRNVPASIALSGRFRIGARADNTTQGHWDGQIDDVRITG